jgi:SAM-dependent methyltransferase
MTMAACPRPQLCAIAMISPPPLRTSPASGRALEIASGTGEHVIRFAGAMPGLVWQPTDPAADRRASIRAWRAAEHVDTILDPLDLDACTPGWAAVHDPADLIFLANLLHLVTEGEARICLSEMAAALAPGGCAAVYGPFPEAPHVMPANNLLLVARKPA